MNVVSRHSPNHNARPVAPDAVVLHADASASAKGSVEWCCTPKPKNPNPVSYHAIVDRDATVYSLVDPRRRAWHAGASSFLGRDNCNDYAIGLCLSNKNDGVEPYTDAQYEVGAQLVAGWMKTYPAITLDRITTHAVVSPGRKTDPKGFDLERFRDLVAVIVGHG